MQMQNNDLLVDLLLAGVEPGGFAFAVAPVIEHNVFRLLVTAENVFPVLSWTLEGDGGRTLD